jgi:hypothetical protein
MPKPAYGQYGATPHLPTPTPPFDGSTSSQLANQPEQGGSSSLLSNGGAPYSNLPGLLPNVAAGPSSYNNNPINSTPEQQQQQLLGNPQAVLSDSTFFNLFWPNWPTSLPSPKLVYNLCDIFFSKKWLCEGIVNKEKFFKGLACPPHHQSFPHVSLLHAVCAVATKFVASDGELCPLWYIALARTV